MTTATQRNRVSAFDIFARSGVLALGLASGMPAVARAAEAPPAQAPATPGEQARQGLELLMQALEGWIRQLPTYAPPEITPDGDIIIRRLDRDRPPPVPPPAPEAPAAPPGGTRT